MRGGAGDDTFIVNATATPPSARWRVWRAAPTRSGPRSTFTLGANIENLTLTGNAAINGTGNALNNFITANGGSNSS